MDSSYLMVFPTELFLEYDYGLYLSFIDGFVVVSLLVLYQRSVITGFLLQWVSIILCQLRESWNIDYVPLPTSSFKLTIPLSTIFGRCLLAQAEVGHTQNFARGKLQNVCLCMDFLRPFLFGIGVEPLCCRSRSCTSYMADFLWMFRFR